MRRIEIFLCASMAAFAASANPGALDEAKQVLDQAAPSQCELLAMQFQGPSRSAEFRLRAAELESALAPDMQRFEAAKAALTPVELGELKRHSLALLEECSKQAYAAYGVRIPTPVDTQAQRPKIVPYAPTMVEKSTQGEAAVPGAMQKQAPLPQ